MRAILAAPHNHRYSIRRCFCLRKLPLPSNSNGTLFFRRPHWSAASSFGLGLGLILDVGTSRLSLNTMGQGKVLDSHGHVVNLLGHGGGLLLLSHAVEVLGGLRHVPLAQHALPGICLDLVLVSNTRQASPSRQDSTGRWAWQPAQLLPAY